MNKPWAMENLKADIRACSSCQLCVYSTNQIIGNGSLRSKIVFIGEAPGKEEDVLGEPFVGSAGKLLNQVLEKTGFSRKNVYVTNLIRCRPPKNRKPMKNELDACSKYLERELDFIRPKIIAPLGNTALYAIMRKLGLKPSKIGDIHGKIFETKFPWGNVMIIPLYHPAAALYNKNLLELIEEDFKKLKKYINQS
jgi:DNA polymerase